MLVRRSSASTGRQSTISSMAPLDQYLMERNAEIALARNAARNHLADAESWSSDAWYETAVKGKNGFVCMVNDHDRGIDDPILESQAAICFNPPAAERTSNTIKRTELVLGKIEAQMFEGIKVAFDKKELPALESGAMCYMMSKQSYLSDRDPHWHSH